MSEPWFIYAIFATLFYGLISFLYKTVAHRGYSSLKILNIQALTVAVIAGFFVGGFKHPASVFKMVLLFAALNSLFFALGTVLKMTALKYIPLNVAVPIGKLNSVFAIFIGIVFFHETPSKYQYLGIILAMTAVFLLIKPQSKGTEAKSLHLKGFLIAFFGAVSVAISVTAGKLASASVPKIDYVFFSYSFVALYTFLTGKTPIGSMDEGKSLDREGYLLGFVLGLLNLTGYLLILQAWAAGPMSLVQAVFSLSMIIAILLARIFYKEKFTPRNLIAITISLIAVYLIKG
ncbi:MAG: DMT family transporter [Elusimicrobia bacterium]|nr:DMT family transporter [Elusimicrobiota bacterium]